MKTKHWAKLRLELAARKQRLTESLQGYGGAARESSPSAVLGQVRARDRSYGGSVNGIHRP